MFSLSHSPRQNCGLNGGPRVATAPAARRPARPTPCRWRLGRFVLSTCHAPPRRARPPPSGEWPAGTFASCPPSAPTPRAPATTSSPHPHPPAGTSVQNLVTGCFSNCLHPSLYPTPFTIHILSRVILTKKKSDPVTVLHKDSAGGSQRERGRVRTSPTLSSLALFFPAPPSRRILQSSAHASPRLTSRTVN